MLNCFGGRGGSLRGRCCCWINLVESRWICSGSQTSTGNLEGGKMDWHAARWMDGKLFSVLFGSGSRSSHLEEGVVSVDCDVVDEREGLLPSIVCSMHTRTVWRRKFVARILIFLVIRSESDGAPAPGRKPGERVETDPTNNSVGRVVPPAMTWRSQWAKADSGCFTTAR